MSKISRDQAVSALAVVVREALVEGEAVHIPELGTLHIEHRPSHTEQQPDGSVVMCPPRKEIVFTPE